MKKSLEWIHQDSGVSLEGYVRKMVAARRNKIMHHKDNKNTHQSFIHTVDRNDWLLNGGRKKRRPATVPPSTRPPSSLPIQQYDTYRNQDEKEQLLWGVLPGLGGLHAHVYVSDYQGRGCVEKMGVGNQVWDMTFGR